MFKIWLSLVVGLQGLLQPSLGFSAFIDNRAIEMRKWGSNSLDRKEVMEFTAQWHVSSGKQSLRQGLSANVFGEVQTQDNRMREKRSESGKDEKQIPNDALLDWPLFYKVLALQDVST